MKKCRHEWEIDVTWHTMHPVKNIGVFCVKCKREREVALNSVIFRKMCDKRFSELMGEKENDKSI